MSHPILVKLYCKFKSFFTSMSFWANVQDDTARGTICFAHNLDLMVAFWYIALIDADCVCPEYSDAIIDVGISEIS